MLGQIFQMILSFFIGLWAVRYLGPSDFGSITYISSYIALFTAACTMGLDTVVVNRLVRFKERDGEIVTSAIFLRAITALISMGALAMVVAFVDHGDRKLLWIALLSGFELLFKAAGTISYWYQYKLLSKKTALADMAAFTIASLYRLWLLISGKNIYWFAFYNSFIYLMIAVFYIPMFKKDVDHAGRPTAEMCKDLLRGSLPYLISAILVSLYTQIDQIMIKQILKSTAQVGYYATALTLTWLIAFVPNSISVSARPVLMDLKNKGAEDYEKRVTQVLASIIWISFLCAVLFMIFANPIIRLLYGPSYAPAAPVLRILVWSAIAENMTKIRDIWLIGARHSRFVTLLSTCGTLVNVLLNALLIPRIGIIGAAVATVVTQFAVTVFVPLLFGETRRFGLDVVNAFTLRNMGIRELYAEIRTALRGQK